MVYQPGRMSTPITRIAAFASAVALLSGGAAVAGGAIDPRGGGGASGKEPGHGHSGMGSATTATQASADTVRGLAVAEDGLRLVVDTPELRRGRNGRLAYRVVDARGDAVRDFDVEHEKRMHLIVVRRDLTGFQHLHPQQAADGTWTTSVRLDDAGSYRLFADFATGGKPHTLASDLRVDGSADLVDLPAPAPRARTSDGYDVRLDGSGEDLRFTVMRGGRVVHVEPYLGAGGHLVALREGDLAFLHVHPVTGEGHDDSIRFGATFPTAGRYRLFLQFKHEGRVHTAAFTKAVR
jgi:hypothetical protein